MLCKHQEDPLRRFEAPKVAKMFRRCISACNPEKDVVAPTFEPIGYDAVDIEQPANKGFGNPSIASYRAIDQRPHGKMSLPLERVHDLGKDANLASISYYMESDDETPVNFSPDSYRPVNFSPLNLTARNESLDGELSRFFSTNDEDPGPMETFKGGSGGRTIEQVNQQYYEMQGTAAEVTEVPPLLSSRSQRNDRLGTAVVRRASTQKVVTVMSPRSSNLSPASLLHSVNAASSTPTKANSEAAKRGWKPSFNDSVSINGLVSKKQSNMIIKTNDLTRKHMCILADFLRESLQHPVVASEHIIPREQTALFYLFLACVELAISTTSAAAPNSTDHAKTIIATVITNTVKNAESDPAFATPKIRSTAKYIHYMAKAYYTPILEYLASPSSHPNEIWIRDLHNTARVLMGSKPPDTEIRMQPIILEATNLSWCKCFEWGKEKPEEFEKLKSELIEEFKNKKKLSSGSPIECMNKIRAKFA